MFDYLNEQEAIFRYKGNSMWPLFQDGDLLVIEQLQVGQLQPGDCIVYQKTGEERYTVHRIIQIRPEIRTRGDNQSVADNEPVSHNWILGRVESRIRFGNKRRIMGGKKGAWIGRVYRFVGKLDPSDNSRGGKISKLFQRVFGRITAVLFLKARIAAFRSADGRQKYYILVGNCLMGEYDEEKMLWFIPWPYNLVIDPDHLVKRLNI